MQLAKWGGAKVIATVSSEEKASRASMIDHIINYRKEDVLTRVMALTNGEGVDRILDVNFGVNWETNYKILKINGTIASYSSMGDRRPAFPHYELMLSSVTIRLVMIHCSPPDSLTKAAEDIVRAMEEDALTHAIAAHFPLNDLAVAHEAVESEKMIGNILVDIE